MKVLIGKSKNKVMPFVTNSGIDIHYQTEGDPSNSPIIFLHWFMGDMHTFYATNYVRSLQDNYLILLDHRGYGKSSKPYTPEQYHPKYHVDDIRAVMRELDLDQARFFGYSMGGRIAFALIEYAPELIESLVIGGMHPYEEIPTNIDRRIELLKQGMDVVLDAYDIQPQSIRERMRQNDPQALLADTRQTKHWEGLTSSLSSFSKPVLLFVGEYDPFYDGVKQAAEELNNATFVGLTGEDHRSAFVKRNLLMPHLRRFWSL